MVGFTVYDVIELKVELVFELIQLFILFMKLYCLI